jgi:trimethylamine monooxygenase
MFDAQAWYGRDWVLGKIDLPSNEEQQAHWLKWRTKEEALENCVDNARY